MTTTPLLRALAKRSVREYVFYVFFRFQKNMTFYVFFKKWCINQCSRVSILRFFFKIQKHDFYVFELLHRFSRILAKRRVVKMKHEWNHISRITSQLWKACHWSNISPAHSRYHTAHASTFAHVAPFGHLIINRWSTR